jgi:glycosyltransferase involved in cell wall biosynthesis
MNSNPLISIITCFLNAEKFFEEAIQSVLTQTYTNWELLLVDDGSTDSSTQIAKRYAEEKSGKVSYLEHEGHQNRGKSTSRNLGFRHAKGEYIAFLDADDIFLPQKLEKQVTALQTYPDVGMICGPYYMWYSWTNNPEDVQRDKIFPIISPDIIQSETLVKPPALFYYHVKHQASTPTTCSILLRSKVIKEIGVFDESFQLLCEDSVLFAKVFLKTTVMIESGCWDRYRQHSDSSIHIAVQKGQYHKTKPNPAVLEYWKWIEKYMVEQKVSDLKTWQALQEQLWIYRHPSLNKILHLPRSILPLAVKKQLKATLCIIQKSLRRKYKGTRENT